MYDAEAIVIGGGHNGLICAAYLAKAGVTTILVEARDSVGGGASTVAEMGARFNICACDHSLIRAMPLIDEFSGLHVPVEHVAKPQSRRCSRIPARCLADRNGLP